MHIFEKLEFLKRYAFELLNCIAVFFLWDIVTLGVFLLESTGYWSLCVRLNYCLDQLWLQGLARRRPPGTAFDGR